MLISNRPLINMYDTPQPPPGVVSGLQPVPLVLTFVAFLMILISGWGVVKSVSEYLDFGYSVGDSIFEYFSRNLSLIAVPGIIGLAVAIVDFFILSGDESNNSSTNNPSASETVSSTTVPTTSPKDTGNAETTGNIDWSHIATIAGWALLTIAMIAVIGLIARITWKHVKKSRKRHEQWGRIKERISEIKAEYAAAESDPTTIVTRPLILDVEYQYTKVFHERLADADRCVVYGELDEAEYQLTRLTTAWQRLLSQSKHAGIPRVSAKTKARAQRLLDMVLSTTSTDGERATAWQNLAEILNEAGISEIIQEKALAMRELQAVAMPQLEA